MLFPYSSHFYEFFVSFYLYYAILHWSFENFCFGSYNQGRGLGKLRCQGAICWLKKELTWRLGTLKYRIVVGLRLFINQIFFENVDEKKYQKMTAMPTLT